eukprot:scpid33968/ scgid0848/ 
MPPTASVIVLFAVALHLHNAEADEGMQRRANVRFTKDRSDTAWPPAPVLDSRYIASSTHSTVMLERAYLDQPYCVVADSQHRPDQKQQHGPNLSTNPMEDDTPAHKDEFDQNGAGIPRWVCVVTADKYHEGGNGEQIVSLYSDDYGKTWSQPVELEPNITLANAYATIAITSYGRIYAMYNYNADNVTHLPDGKSLPRQDTLGHFVMKYSDDRGATWSKARYEIPYRLTSIDTSNSFSGKVKIMWSVDQAKLDAHDTLYYSFTKIGVYPQNPPEEVWFLASENIMTERDVSKVTWKLLPDGDHGIPPPGGNPNIAEEGHIMPMPNGLFYSVFRTTQGLLAACYTPGPTAAKWNDCNDYFAEYQRSITGKSHFLKNPRGPITMKQFSNGRYLLLYYNNGNTGFTSTHTTDAMDDAAPVDRRETLAASTDNSRNPYWLASGIALDDGRILWSQPEIIIYDRVPTRPGYPDFIEIPSTGQIFITETQKTTARLHEINKLLLSNLWEQHNSTTVASDYAAKYEKSDSKIMPMASLPTFGNYTREDDYVQGFTVLFWLEPLQATNTQTLLTSYEHDYHKGLGIVWQNSTINFTTSDNYALGSCTTDSVCSSRLQSTTEKTHQLAVTVDNGPFMITLAVDGVLCDGGHDRARGSCWMDNQLRDVNGLANATVGDSVMEILLYNRALFNSEVVANYNSKQA